MSFLAKITSLKVAVLRDEGERQEKRSGKEKEMESDGRRVWKSVGCLFLKLFTFSIFLIIKQRKSVGLVHVSYKTK